MPWTSSALRDLVSSRKPQRRTLGLKVAGCCPEHKIPRVQGSRQTDERVLFPWADWALWGQRPFPTLAPRPGLGLEAGVGLEAGLGLVEAGLGPHPGPRHFGSHNLWGGHLCICWGHHGLGLFPLIPGGLQSPPFTLAAPSESSEPHPKLWDKPSA